MNEKQERRLKQAFTVLWFLMLIVILALLYLLFKPQQPPTITNYIGQKGPSGSPGLSVVGPTGLQGASIVGPQGIPGTNSVSTNTIELQPIIQNTPVPGPKGDKGDTGTPGTQIIINVDPATCQLRSKYLGDDDYQILAQLPVPCEVQ